MPPSFPQATPTTTNAKNARSLGSIARNFSHAQTTTKRNATLVKRFKLQNASRRLLPLHRVSNCLRAIIPQATSVGVKHDAKHARAYYSNLRTCDSVWDCPVCSAKLTERRKELLQKAVTYAHAELGLVPVLMTFTLSHGKRDSLKHVLGTLKSAFHNTFSGRWYADFKAAYGLEGYVRATEVTYGENGFHPHFHVLMFFAPMTAKEYGTLKASVKSRWVAQLGKLGASALHDVACDIRDADTHVYDYIAKYGHEPSEHAWGIESELAKAPSKTASRHGLTPFQLLESYDNGNKQHGALFVEYAETFKGSHQLQWTNGLKALLCVDDKAKSDEQDEHQLLAEFSRKQWWDFMHLPHDLRGELLAIAGKGDALETQQAIADALKFGFIPERATRELPADAPIVDAKPQPMSENPFLWYARQKARVDAIARQETGISEARHTYVQ